MSPYVYTCMYKYACFLCGCACMFIVYLHCHFYLIFYDRRIRFYHIMHQRYYLKFTVLEFGTLVETTRRTISSYFRSSSVGATHDFRNIFFLFSFTRGFRGSRFDFSLNLYRLSRCTYIVFSSGRTSDGKGFDFIDLDRTFTRVRLFEIEVILAWRVCATASYLIISIKFKFSRKEKGKGNVNSRFTSFILPVIVLRV